ncbi:aspartate ammonia-lyase [Alcaligenes sp.]|uniref:aspartate ammonia-lyase n=1 Tax=Alcaligenes sp. TaxID=512 RepID=UPI003D06E8B7
MTLKLSTDPLYRVERDLLGQRNIPINAYYGINTLRAVENFPISGDSISRYPSLIRALANVKHAAAAANLELGLLDATKAQAIISACQIVGSGAHDDQFIVDMIQGGAGTSTNMNANEVIANLALELLGYPQGQYSELHPNEHVNLCQSTNDVYPTALKLAIYADIQALLSAVEYLRDSFREKAVECKDDLKIGRTQLQDAVPMTLGQEFNAFAALLDSDLLVLRNAAHGLCEINLGGTAIGTGINTPPEYAKAVCDHLRTLTRMPLSTSDDLIGSTQDTGSFLSVSGALKRLAVRVSKISNDLRLLSSGPRAGMGEINLPAQQSGSSIMPGKVNPVIPEVCNQIAFEVIGLDTTVTMAAEAGQLQLNAFEPIIAACIFRSVTHLRNGCEVLANRCVNDITVNHERLADIMTNTIGLATALNPYIGYTNATQVAKEALRSGRGVADVVLERGLLDAAQLATILQPAALTSPSRPKSTVLETINTN